MVVKRARNFVRHLTGKLTDEQIEKLDRILERQQGEEISRSHQRREQSTESTLKNLEESKVMENGELLPLEEKSVEIYRIEDPEIRKQIYRQKLDNKLSELTWDEKLLLLHFGNAEIEDLENSFADYAESRRYGAQEQFNELAATYPSETVGKVVRIGREYVDVEGWDWDNRFLGKGTSMVRQNLRNSFLEECYELSLEELELLREMCKFDYDVGWSEINSVRELKESILNGAIESSNPKSVDKATEIQEKYLRVFDSYTLHAVVENVWEQRGQLDHLSDFQKHLNSLTKDEKVLLLQNVREKNESRNNPDFDFFDSETWVEKRKLREMEQSYSDDSLEKVEQIKNEFFYIQTSPKDTLVHKMDKIIEQSLEETAEQTIKETAKQTKKDKRRALLMQQRGLER